MSHTVEQWGVDEVIGFLSEISLNKYAKVIKKQKLDGKKLLDAVEAKDGGISGIKAKHFMKIKETLEKKMSDMDGRDSPDFFIYNGFKHDEFDEDLDSDDSYEKPVSEDDEKEDPASWLQTTKFTGIQPKESQELCNRDSGVDLTNSRGESDGSVLSFSSYRESVKWQHALSRDSAFSDRSFTLDDADNSSVLSSVSTSKPRNPHYQDKLDGYDWFHGHLHDWVSAELQLKKFAAGRDGVFLVRHSTNKNTHPYTLMVTLKNEVLNIQIYVRPNKSHKFALGSEKLGEQVFSSVEDLVCYHRHHDIIATPQPHLVHVNVRLNVTPPKIWPKMTK